MADITSSPSTPRQSEAEGNEESFDDFNCEPVVRSGHEDACFAPAPENACMPSAMRDLGIRFNSRRKATLHAPIQGFATAYLDQDTSGTYDPRFERATPPDSPPKIRKRKTPREFNENDDSRPRNTKRPVGYTILCTLKFKGEEGLNYLRSITPGPYGSRSSKADDEDLDSPINPDDSGYGLYKTRKKTRQSRKLYGAYSRADGLTIDQLTNGHPQLRGCRNCFEVGDDGCSLIEHAFDYPCTACDDSGIECVLIVPPDLKKVCERCKRKRISCSYRRNGGKGVDACDACEEVGATCCAGPLQELSYARRSSNTGGQSSSRPPPVSAPARVFVSCNQCRNGSLRCSLKRHQTGPCKNCSEAGDTCTFVLERARPATVPAPTAKPTNKRKTKAPPRKHGGTPSTPTGEPYEKRMGNPSTPRTNFRTLYTEAASKKQSKIYSKGKQISELRDPIYCPKLIGITTGVQHIHITTAFCHPIKFNYSADPFGVYPCSWCSSPVFGLWGHGPKTVEVIPWGGDIGNEEIEGGHAADGLGNSRMCIECTNARVRIMMCGTHKVQKIKGLDQRGLNPRLIEESLRALLEEDEKGAELVGRVRWCSVCVAPAEFRCCVSSVNALRGEIEEGCGLLLCLTCADLMERMMRGLAKAHNIQIMDRLTKLWRGERWKREYGEIRADVEFLESSGELATRMEQGMGISNDETKDDLEIGEKEGNKANIAPDGKTGGNAAKDLKWKGKAKDMIYFENGYGILGKSKYDSGSIVSIPKGKNGKVMRGIGQMSGDEPKMLSGDGQVKGKILEKKR